MTLLVCRALPGRVLVMLLKLFEFLNVGAKQVLSSASAWRRLWRSRSSITFIVSAAGRAEAQACRCGWPTRAGGCDLVVSATWRDHTGLGNGVGLLERARSGDGSGSGLFD